MPNKKKHPAMMTNKELAKHVFHPEVLEHAKKGLSGLETATNAAPKPKRKVI